MIERIESWGQELKTAKQQERAEEVVEVAADEEQYSVDRSDSTPVLWGTDQSVLDWVRTGKGKRPW